MTQGTAVTPVGEASRAAAPGAFKVAVCVPVYNDWASALVLLSRIDAVVASIDQALDVLFVDDGSTEPPPSVFTRAGANLGNVALLRLRRNLGHQRAIALGLTYLYVERRYDAVAVMDADGEDRPEDLPLLLERCRAHEWTRVVFAQRAKRSEGLTFRAGYLAFKAIHRLLVGRDVDVGNFSVVPRSALERLVAVGEMWNHYAASVFQARIPNDRVPIARGKRIAGQSKMNLVSLVIHGLSAISVYSEVVGVRLLAFAAAAMMAVMATIIGVVVIRLATSLAIPGWATYVCGLLLLCLVSLCTLSVIMVLFTLRQRSEYAFLPIRDYRHFVMDEVGGSLTSDDSRGAVRDV